MPLILAIAIAAGLLVYLVGSMLDARKYEANPPMIAMTLTGVLLVGVIVVMVLALLKAVP